MQLTARQLNRATLERQLLLQREPLGPVEAVHRVMALQAQSPVSPYVALWNRVAEFRPAQLDAAFAEHAVVKATLMRATLHAVAAADYPMFHGAMQPTLRSTRLADPRFTGSGLSVDDADTILATLVEFAEQPRTGPEFEAFIKGRFGTAAAGVWWAIRTYAPLVHAATGGPYSFGPRPAFVAARTDPVDDDREACLRHLFRCYLDAFGPATVADAAQFAKLARSHVRTAFAGLGDELMTIEGPDGAQYFDLVGRAIPDENRQAPPRLLAMWDSVLLAYAERSRVIPVEYRPRIIRSNGDVLPTLLVDGYVAGVWRPVENGIEASAFHRLPAAVWRELAVEAQGLTALLRSRDATVYRRYARWWDDLPAAQVRTLPA